MITIYQEGIARVVYAPGDPGYVKPKGKREPRPRKSEDKAMTRKNYDVFVDAALATICQEQDIDPRTEVKGGAREEAISKLAREMGKVWTTLTGVNEPCPSKGELQRRARWLADPTAEEFVATTPAVEQAQAS